MRPTRATQPYRKGPRQPGAALTAMLRGRTAGGHNPADVSRVAMLMRAKGKTKRRRPQRPERPPR